ncbi:MAG: NAD(P)H-dependent oxidoreductase [Candidatus Moranbacteria bacterium]|nr:NAD(P)H-dependent oxidoreductase [Candidatus Moranbacteria bacterium]
MKETVNKALLWRYATKVFDPEKILTKEELHPVLDAMRLAPSAFGLPIWKAVVITDKSLRTKLRAAAWNQPQVTDASHLIVLAVRKHIDEKLVDAYIAQMAKTRNTDIESLTGFGDMMKGFIRSKDAGWIREWAARQTYIALGFALETAALHQIDTCPMEGFDPKQFDEILGLDAQGLESKVIFAIGHRSNEDTSALAAKVRLPDTEIFIGMN